MIIVVKIVQIHIGIILVKIVEIFFVQKKMVKQMKIIFVFIIMMKSNYHNVETLINQGFLHVNICMKYYKITGKKTLTLGENYKI